MRISDWSSDVCSSDLVEKLRLEPDFIAVRLFGIGRRCSQRKRIEIVSERRERTDLVVERPRLEAMRVGCVDEQVIGCLIATAGAVGQIGRASCRERVCQYV